jgi:glycerol-3-phosphate dehydrogenase (NAD(P)+)
MSTNKQSGYRIGTDRILPPREYVVTIIGLGKLGSVIADQMTGCEVVGWDPMICGNYDINCDTLYDSIKDADTIFIIVPSDCFEDAVREIVMEYAEHKQWHSATRVNIVSFTKGFCRGRLPIDVLKRELPFNPVGVISGPMLSEEMANQPTRAMFATHNMGIHSTVGIMSRMNNLKVDITDDTTGVTLCGIMKNIYAVGLGMAAGYELGDNAKACIATRAIQEMGKLVGPVTILSYAGIGDFLTTCYSSQSRNYSYGYRWAKGQSIDGIMSEGVKNIDNLIEYSSVDLQVVQAIQRCLATSSISPLQHLVHYPQHI